MKFLHLALVLLVLAGCRQPPTDDNRNVILALDEQQRALVAAADYRGLARLAHRDLQINSPNGRVLNRDTFLKVVQTGEIRAESFARSAETVRISGTAAVVMGRETFTPTPGSELGRRFGAVPLERRYTNVYLFEDGRWQWWARHANVVAR